MDCLKTQQVSSLSSMTLPMSSGQNYLSADWHSSKAHRCLQICLHFFLKQEVCIWFHTENLSFLISDANFVLLAFVQRAQWWPVSHAAYRTPCPTVSLCWRSPAASPKITPELNVPRDISSQRIALMSKQPSFLSLTDFRPLHHQNYQEVGLNDS